MEKQIRFVVARVSGAVGNWMKAAKKQTSSYKVNKYQ